LVRLALAAASLATSVLLAACPQLLDDEFRPAADDGGAGSSTADAATSEAPTRVVESRPAADERGVRREAHIELRFSAPMDTASTEAAYRSTDLPADAVDFAWSDGDRVLQIRPRGGLLYASGPAPTGLPARSYSLSLAAAARDARGRALEPFALTFATARELVVDIPVVASATSSGKYRSDGTDGVGECATAQQTVCVGVGATAGNPSYRGFATFELSSVPADRIALSLAELTLTISAVYGTPFVTLGPLLLESVQFESVGAAAFDAAPRGAATAVTGLASLDDTTRLDVLPMVSADAAEATRSQFRLRFSETVIDDAGPDLIGLNWPTLQLRVGYLVP
jgi:hypothetical protein